MFRTAPILIALISGLLTPEFAIADCQRLDAAESDFPESLVSVQTSTGIESAWYDDATDRYAHGVLGDAIEPSSLVLNDGMGCTLSVVLDPVHVFEDLMPRLADIDKSPGVEVITVRSHQDYGAQIAVYQLAGDAIQLLATTPYIGTANRWLAPVGIADFNNDGDMDIAFVDRPHLAKVLRVWSYRDGELHQIAEKSGLTNHRIGEDFISGGVKICGETASMITADKNWSQVIETKLEDDQLVSVEKGALLGTESLTDAFICD